MLAYNTEPYIRESIESVLAQQLEQRYELVIAEDASTDNTLAIAREYEKAYPEKIRVIANPQNLGLLRNYCTTLQKCTGEYIAILDSDDVWTDPLKLKRQIEILDSHPEFGVVYTDCTVVDDKGFPIDWDLMEQYRKRFRSGHLFFDLLGNGPFIPNLTSFFRRSLLVDVFYENPESYFVDWWLWLRLSCVTEFCYLPARTSAYRWHSGNYSKSQRATPEAEQRMMAVSVKAYHSILKYYSRFHHEPLNPEEKSVLFRKLLMVLRRSPVGPAGKAALLPLCWRYAPGWKASLKIFMKKFRPQTGLAGQSS